MAIQTATTSKATTDKNKTSPDLQKTFENLISDAISTACKNGLYSCCLLIDRSYQSLLPQLETLGYKFKVFMNNGLMLWLELKWDNPVQT